jgi:dipeptidase
MFAPSLHLPSETDPMANDYPFSVPVDSSKRIGVEDLMRAQRDHFEGTPYSTADGLAAGTILFKFIIKYLNPQFILNSMFLGPFGDPNRFDVWKNGNMTIWDAIEGEFPRTISLFRTSYSIVAHVRIYIDSSTIIIIE